MQDPEDSLSFRFKRAQFNHRLPVQVIELFDEFGDDKKYLLEYILWTACKLIGTRIAVMDKLEVQMLDRYFQQIKEHLGKNPQFGQELGAFFSFEQEFSEKMVEKTSKNASSFASGQ